MQFVTGAQAALSGFAWVFRPKIRRFVYIPLAINVVLFSLAFVLLGHYAEDWVSAMVGTKDEWWALFRWAYDLVVPVLSWLLYAAMTLVVYFGFSTLANIIAAPFNAHLAKAVETRLSGDAIAYDEMPLLKEIWVSVASELAKVVRFLAWSLVLLLLLFIPGVNVFFPAIWFVFMAYNLSIQYIDYPMSNHQIFYTQQRQMLKRHNMQRLGFGCVANVLLLIPVLNFLAMPVCVCGATVWWHKHVRNTIQ